MKKRSKAILKKGIALLCMLSLITAMFTGCRLTADQVEDNDDKKKLSVVTTIFPQYDFVREIAGDLVDVQMLLKPGEETHSYEPTPQDIIAILHADLFIYVGGENDVWVEDILEMPEMADVHTLRLVDCVDTLEEHEHETAEECEEEHDPTEECVTEQNEHTEEFASEEHEHVEELASEEHVHTDECDHGEEGVHTFDEHVWTSPLNAVSITEHIAEELSVLDKKNAGAYRENCALYIEKLKDLDQDFRDVVENADYHTVLFGDRYPFKYFEEEYGLSHYAAFSGCASDTEPSAAIMAYLIDKVEEENIPVVLKMELSNESISQAIAEATGTKVMVFNSCHNLSAEQFEAGEGYLSLMQENVNTLKEALEIWH